MNQYLQKSHHIFSSLVLCLPISAIADGIDVFEDDEFALPIVTSASRLSESVLSSPSAVTVIDRAMIDASGFLEIADVMRLVPGFIVSHAYGGNMAVTSHGEGWEFPNRMQILIDGRSTYTNALSAIEWNALGVHLEDIERIEVVRGPAASAYGSNSYSGAINIVTKAPELDDKYQLRYRQGNIGEQEILLRHSGKFDNIDYRFTGASRHNKGYEKALEIRANPDIIFDDYRDNKDLNELSLTTRLRLSPSNSIWANFSYTDSEVQSPNLYPEGLDLFTDPTISINAWSANIKWEKQLSENEELAVSFFHNYLDEDDLSSFLISELYGPAVPALIGEPDQRISFGLRSYHSHRSDIEAQYSKIFDNGFQYVIGLGSRYDTIESDAFFPMKGQQSNTSYRIYANGQLPIKHFLTINAGGLYEMNRIEDSHFSPRASLNFHINQLQTIRLGYSAAYRIPSLTEKNMEAGSITEAGLVLDREFEAADDIKAEKITSIDVSYLGKIQNFPLSWEIRAYKEKYQDTVGFILDKTELDFIDNRVKVVDNSTDSQMYGFEGELTLRPEKYSFIRINFNVGHMSGKRIRRIESDSSITYRDLEDQAPQSTYGILLGKQVNSWNFGLGFYHVAEMKWDGFGDQVDSYNRLDASITKKFEISHNQHLQLKLVGQNITNNEYNEFMIDTDLTFEPRYYASISLIHE